MEHLERIEVADSRSANGSSWLSAFTNMFMAYWRESKKMGVIYYHE